MSERDLLLQRTSDAPQGDGQIKGPKSVGPLDISRSTRYGILAGLWTATFLSVSFCYIFIIQCTTDPKIGFEP